jgi:hypothetical protein
MRLLTSLSSISVTHLCTTPEYFLPKGCDLTVFSHANSQLSGERYVVGQYRTLRISGFALNVFLVVLNDQISTVQDMTNRLADLIYWFIIKVAPASIKGVRESESRTGTRLVSPGHSPEKKNLTSLQKVFETCF